MKNQALNDIKAFALQRLQREYGFCGVLDSPEFAMLNSSIMTSIYAPRNHAEQGEHYLRHIDAMTKYDLRDKSSIAGELADRDIEIEELDALSVKLADILSRIAIALRGPQPELTRWSWHDLPERATAEVASRQAAQIENEKLKDRIVLFGVELRQAVRAERKQVASNCAKICEDIPTPADIKDNSDGRLYEIATLDCESAIKARFGLDATEAEK